MAYKQISYLWAKKCERGEKNFFDVPAKLQDEVRAIIEEDGFVINDDGTVTERDAQTE